MRFPIGIAYHFAKHLAEHTFNSKNTTYNIGQLDERIEKGLIKEDAVTGVSDEKMRIMAMNSKPEVVSTPMPQVLNVEMKVAETKEVKPKKKMGRPKKVVPAEPVKSDLEGFEGK